MQLKLPVDVHLAVGSDGTLILVVGGLGISIKPDELPSVLSGKPLKQKQQSTTKIDLLRESKNSKNSAKSISKSSPNLFSSQAVSKRKRMGLCAWCNKKPVPGKKLCEAHLAGARRVAKEARRLKESSK